MIEFFLEIPMELQVIILSCITMGVIQFIKDLDKQISINDANIEAKKFITNLSDQTFDYFEFRNTNSLGLEGNISDARLFYAIYKGQTRLIDNIDM